MLYYYLLFFFVTVGAKLVLAMITIYLLLPSDRQCTRCDGETLLMRPRRPARLGFRVFLGRVQWRWCPQCGWEGLSRGGGGSAPSSDVQADHTAPTRR